MTASKDGPKTSGSSDGDGSGHTSGRGRGSGMSVTKIVTLTFVFTVLFALLIQGLAVHSIGFGPFQITFKDEGPSQSVSGTGIPSASVTMGHKQATGSAPQDTATDGGSTDSVVTGVWSQTRGPLTLTVTEVDIQGGYVTLHVKARNQSQDQMVLPTYGYFIATDDTGATYEANQGDTHWPINVPSGTTVTGTIELDGLPSTRAHTLSISFGTIFGFSAPSGSISIPGIKLRP